MIRQIRRGVFETNSSSTHSITMVSAEEYEKWKKGELLLDEGWKSTETFISREQAIEKLKSSEYYNDLDYEDEDAVDDALREEELKSYDKFWDNDELESYEDSYTTKSGEKVIAFGLYGMDN